MKSNKFLAFALILTFAFFVGSCKLYQTETHGYEVDIEIIESPTEGRMVNLEHNEKIQIEFTTHPNTEIAEVFVILQTENSDNFNIDGDNVEAKSHAIMYTDAFRNQTDENDVFNIRNYNVKEVEYTFEQEVDLSIYPSGTCFVLFCFARPSEDWTEHNEYNSNSIYFCKKN